MIKPSGICATCENPSSVTLPVRLSIDSATSTYTSANTRLAFCQACMDHLGGPMLQDAHLNRRALLAAVSRLRDALERTSMHVS